MNNREQRGQQIAARLKIFRRGVRWIVPSQSGTGSYIVDVVGEEPTCTCADFELQRRKCKHILAVECLLRGEARTPDTPPTPTLPHPTYRQDWPAYNYAQTHEKALFQTLLHDLCQTIGEPEQHMGRPRHALGDMVFAAAFKVYATVSARRFACDLQEAHAKGYLQTAPHHSSVFRIFENPDVTPILRRLIEQSSLPMKVAETTFAVDSTGFSTCTYTRWFNAKYGGEIEQHDWLKAHLICGTTTNIVTGVEITSSYGGDSPQFEPLVQATAAHFAVDTIVADKAYSSRGNLELVTRLGATPYIPFRRNTTAKSGGSPLWEKLYGYYLMHREEFLQQYHRRSLVESTMWMIKAKFGGAIRSKTPTAQVNELLCKVLCHNICVVIQSMYELGIEPNF